MKTKKVTLIEEVKFVDFPDLMFYHSEDETIYFDATDYLRTKQIYTTHRIEEFRKEFGFWEKAILQTYNIDNEDIVIIDAATGNYLIEQSMALLFIAYTNVEYGVNILEKIDDLFQHGFVLSDTFILISVSQRFTLEELKYLIT